MPGRPLVFGRQLAGVSYTPRPGCYAIISAPDGRIALVRTRHGLHLPGGGQHPSETLEATLEREVAEECGLTLADVRYLGRALEYLHAPDEGYFVKDCHFFVARPARPAAGPSEADHELEWAPPALALDSLRTECHRWALRTALTADVRVTDPGGSSDPDPDAQRDKP